MLYDKDIREPCRRIRKVKSHRFRAAAFAAALFVSGVKTDDDCSSCVKEE